MNTDFRVSVDFFSHHKAIKLEKRLGPGALLALLRLWAYAARLRPGGGFAGMSNEDIELAAGWSGQDDAFIAALLETGFVDKSDTGLYLHDWAENNPWVAEMEERSDKARFSRLATVNRRVYDELRAAGVSAINRAEYERFAKPPRLSNPLPDNNTSASPVCILTADTPTATPSGVFPGNTPSVSPSGVLLADIPSASLSGILPANTFSAGSACVSGTLPADEPPSAGALFDGGAASVGSHLSGAVTVGSCSSGTCLSKSGPADTRLYGVRPALAGVSPTPAPSPFPAPCAIREEDTYVSLPPDGGGAAQQGGGNAARQPEPAVLPAPAGGTGQALPGCPHQSVIKLYHECLPELPRVRAWNDTRKKHLAARWRETMLRLQQAGEACSAENGLEWWRKFFLHRVRPAPLLMGKVTRGGGAWRASLDWLIKPENYAKTLEGQYLERRAR